MSRRLTPEGALPGSGLMQSRQNHPFSATFPLSELAVFGREGSQIPVGPVLSVR